MVILSMMGILVMDVIYKSTYNRNPYENWLMSFPYGKTSLTMAQSGTILGSSKKKDMPSHSQQRKLWVPYPPKSMLSHHFAWKGLSKKHTAITVRMPAYIGHHWSRRGMCDVTKCRRMAFFWRTQYGKICSSSAPLQGTLGMFDDRVNPWNLLPELAFQWQISHKQAPLYTSIRSLPILHQIHRICDPRLKKASQLGST
jgi:hypothetical protein